MGTNQPSISRPPQTHLPYSSQLPPNNNPIFAMSWNIRSMTHNLDELKILLTRHNPTIVTLQEIIRIPNLNSPPLNNYNWFFHQATNTSNHSVCIGIQKHIPSKQINLSSNIPAIAAKISSPIECTIVSLYLSPSLPSAFLALETENILQQLPSPTIVLGDFNAQHSSWGCPTTNSRGNLLQTSFDTSYMEVIYNTIATRICSSRGTGSILDYCAISSSIAQDFSIQIANDTHGSDHYPLFVHTHHSTPSPLQRPRWKYEEADWDKYTLEITYTLPLDNPPCLTRFTDTIKNAASISIPLTKGSAGKRSVHWWNETVAQAIRDRRKALRNLRRSNQTDNIFTQLLAEQYREANRIAKAAIKSAKQEAWNKFTDEINPTMTSKEIYKRVAILSGKKHKPTPIILKTGNTVIPPTEIPETLAKHFSDTSATQNFPSNFQTHKSISESIPLPNIDASNSKYNSLFSMEELNWALHKCRGKSSGPDNIGYPLLQHLPFCAKTVLLQIYNNIWLSGTIPEDWKSSYTIPIPKPNKPTQEIDSYRPISLLNCIGKIMERMVNRRLMTELEERKLLSTDQHAFRSGKGTETYFAKLDDIIEKHYPKNQHIDLGIIDLSKAFDRTWRHAILEQLNRWGFGGRLMTYLQSFLSNRSFRVLIGTLSSTLHVQENGVPQGAILSPTLFLISIESLFCSIPSNIKSFVYADDIILISASNSIAQSRKNLQSGIDKVKQWSRWTGYEISHHKSKILHICNSFYHRLKPIKYKDSTIPNVRKADILGVTFDRHLTFNQHSTRVKKEAKSRINLFRLLGTGKHRASRQILLRIINGWLLPKLLYGIEIVSRERSNFEKKIAPLYHTAIRYATGAFITSPIASLLCESGLQPLDLIITQKVTAAAARMTEKNMKATALTSRARTFLTELTQQPIPSVTKLARIGSRPWYCRPPKIDWTIKYRLRAGCSNIIAKRNFTKLVQEKYSNHHLIFTDGSVHNGTTGCGIFSSFDNCAIRLPDHTSIFSAEAIALLIATEESLRSDKPNVIFTDSASVLQALENGTCKDPHIQHLSDIPDSPRVSFCWIPGHTGIRGNEKADQLANDARNHPPCYDNNLSRRDFINWSKTIIANNWYTTWFRSTTTSLRLIKTTTTPWEDPPSHQDQRKLSRLRIGHTRLTHSYIIDRSSPPLCSFCGVTITIHHILTTCYGYTAQRISCQLDTNIDTILSPNSNHQKNLLQFLKTTGLYDEI